MSEMMYDNKHPLVIETDALLSGEMSLVPITLIAWTDGRVTCVVVEVDKQNAILEDHPGYFFSAVSYRHPNDEHDMETAIRAALHRAFTRAGWWETKLQRKRRKEVYSVVRGTLREYFHPEIGELGEWLEAKHGA